MNLRKELGKLFAQGAENLGLIKSAETKAIEGIAIHIAVIMNPRLPERDDLTEALIRAVNEGIEGLPNARKIKVLSGVLEYLEGTKKLNIADKRNPADGAIANAPAEVKSYVMEKRAAYIRLSMKTAPQNRNG